MPAEHLSPFVHERDGTRISLLADPALSDADAAMVFDSLMGRKPRRHILDGDRSLVFPALGPSLHGEIKIKGAGYQGGPVRMGRHHDKPYPLPRYDAEGAATLDAAKDHGRTYAGAMSYQQARHEFIVSRYLHQSGIRVFPASGDRSLQGAAGRAQVRRLEDGRADGPAGCRPDWPDAARGLHRREWRSAPVRGPARPR